MPYAPRTIALLCELRHPPTSVDPRPIQRIHNRMFESGEPTYHSFTSENDVATLFNPSARPGAASLVSFHADRILFREELSSLTMEEFAGRVREVATEVAELRRLQVFVAQIVTVRTLVNPRHFKDSRAFLKDAVCGIGDALPSFQRSPELFGLRLVFPPSREEPHAFTLRVESFANDPRSIFLENQGAFGPTIVANGLASLEAGVRTTYAFLVDRALGFLSHFDSRQEA